MQMQQFDSQKRLQLRPHCLCKAAFIDDSVPVSTAGILCVRMRSLGKAIDDKAGRPSEMGCQSYIIHY